MRSDDLCSDHAAKGTKLTVRMLDDDLVLIEGDDEALHFLADLLRAATEPGEDGVQIGPTHGGNTLFSDESTLGLYLHRVPCPEHR